MMMSQVESGQRCADLLWSSNDPSTSPLVDRTSNFEALPFVGDQSNLADPEMGSPFQCMQRHLIDVIDELDHSS